MDKKTILHCIPFCFTVLFLFKETFAAEVNASLADGQQHDAQEFQIYLLDALHEDTNRVISSSLFPLESCRHLNNLI